MKDILLFLKEEFEATDRVGIMLGPEETLQVIRALENTAKIHKAWVEQYREIERLQDREHELEARVEGLRKIAMRAAGHMPYSEATIYQQDIDKILNDAH